MKRINHYHKLLNIQQSKAQSFNNRTKLHVQPFRACIETGLFTVDDLKELKRRYQESIAKSGHIKPVKTHLPRETVENTTRYSQLPRTATIYGGRNAR